jgi:hypothetical protein
MFNLFHDCFFNRNKLFKPIAKILLHVHPLLSNGLVNKSPWRQILGKQSLARLCNNSDNRSVYTVVCAMPSAKQQNCEHVYNNTCFLWGRCRRFIGDSEGQLQSVIAEKPWVKDMKPSRKCVVRIQLLGFQLCLECLVFRVPVSRLP